VSLAAYVVRRLLQLVPIALGVTILVFFLIHLVPGDPARTILGNQATPARVALVRHQFGLDRPLTVQYEKFMGRLVRGDLGSSLFYSVPAGRLVLQRLPVTLWLIGFGTLLSVLVAVPLAVIAATNRNRLPDQIVRAVPLVGLGFPPFWLGIMLLLVFGLHLGRAFPVGGYGGGFFGHVHAMFLPDYVVTARSKGLPERRVVRRHALRNAVISTVSVLGVNVGFLVGATLVIEQVYALPGIGQLMINSIFQRDFPVVQAVTLVFAVMVVLVYLTTDVIHALLDPRVRYD